MAGMLIVTGGSRGIGAACARLAAQRGWSVVVNYSASSEAANAVVAEITVAGGHAIAVKADVANEADVVALFDTAEAALGPVRGLINNAGILDRAATLAEIGLPRWERTMSVNATGSFLAAREAVRRMLRHAQGGAIVNMSSLAAHLGAANDTNGPMS